jgi:hypothetical protein
MRKILFFSFGVAEGDIHILPNKKPGPKFETVRAAIGKHGCYGTSEDKRHFLSKNAI